MKKVLPPRLRMFLQPIIEPRFARIVACEAVVRLSGKDVDNVTQEIFFPIAEKAGLTSTLSKWRFEEICKTTKRLIDNQVNFSYISFDVMQKTLRRKTYVSELLYYISEYNISPKRLCLEIREDYFAVDYNNIIERIEELKKEGFKVAVDNYSGVNVDLSKLDVIPLDIIKVSKTIVDRLSFDAKAIERLSAIVKTAEGLGIHVQAEGVEKKEQQLVLMDHGCNYMQGNLYGDLTTASALLKKSAALKA